MQAVCPSGLPPECLLAKLWRRTGLPIRVRATAGAFFAARSVRHLFNTFADFAQGQHTDVQGLGRDIFEPRQDCPGLLGAHQFRNDVGAEQIAQNLTLRLGVCLRAISRSLPTSGDARNNSTRLGLGWVSFK